jgi:hypothetical protein
MFRVYQTVGVPPGIYSGIAAIRALAFSRSMDYGKFEDATGIRDLDNDPKFLKAMEGLKDGDANTVQLIVYECASANDYPRPPYYPSVFVMGFEKEL